MNGKSAFNKAIRVSFFVLFAGFSFIMPVQGEETKAQGKETPITPYLQGIGSINDGYLEVGAEINKSNWTIRPLFKVPLTDKQEGTVQLDRQTNTLSSILDVDLDFDPTGETGRVNNFRIGTRVEWGIEEFTFYPEGKKENRQKESKQSLTVEMKGMWYTTEGEEYASQWAPQFRLRYGRVWEKAEEVGVVSPSANGSLAAVNGLVIDPPKTYPALSLAFALPYFPGKGKFSCTPVLYYQLTGKPDSRSPFENAGRLRIEVWVSYYQSNKPGVNVRFGAGPFIGYRTHGDDKFDRLVYGGMIQMKIVTNSLAWL